jgi:magnesium transporter
MPSILQRTRNTVPIVLVSTTLLKFASASRAAALALPDVGIAVFFIAGLAYSGAGDAGPWFVLAAVLLGLACRTLDIEGWGLFIPGGLVGRAGLAFGPRAAAGAAAAQLLERLLFTGLVCVVFGHYIAAVPLPLFVPVVRWQEYLARQDLAGLGAIGLLGFAWTRARLGYATNVDRAVRRTWLGVSVLVAMTVWAAISVALPPEAGDVASPLTRLSSTGSHGPVLHFLLLTLSLLVAFGHALPAVASGDSLARAAGELEPPRFRGLRRTMLILTLYGIAITAASAYFFQALPVHNSQPAWLNAPLLGVVQHLTGPSWLRGLMAALVVASATLLLGQAARAGISGAETQLARLAQQGGVSRALTLPHAHLGTLARAIDTAAAVAALAIVASAGRVQWIAHAYGATLAWTLLLKVAVLVRLRRPREDSPFRVPLNLGAFREWPLGLWAIGAAVAATWLAMVLSGDAPTIGASLALAGIAFTFAAASRRALPVQPDEADTFRLLPSTGLSLSEVRARPGCVLVAVRNPHSLSHVAHAIQAARGRDVVVMTARLLGVDAEYEDPRDPKPTTNERVLFSNIVAMAEHHGRTVRLLIVPSYSVSEAVVDAVLRLQASEVYVGESSTLSSEAQAARLGEAWEKAPATALHGVRLVILHPSGRTDVFHLGAHDPELSPGDLDLIHQLWLDAVKSVGPKVHHHDVVRAALTQMAHQLNGPEREHALQAIRTAARPADELAAIVKTRDYSKLRDIIRNRPPESLASLLGELSIEDQVVVFRLLPRKDAAATFEYLSLEEQEALLKAMAQEDVAALLNEMAPDDRTMFLEELPAAATRQLLALLTPEERAVASTLLGYPEGSIGRLMTPAYIAVREDWTVQQVLDYVREHGQDSETLNVIYVVDEQGRLIDDIRIRELLLTAPNSRVVDLMDRRFVVLKATDDQETAIAEFRAHDRTALPVTDTSGMLIGIVTIDDVLDVAEAKTTEDIQRIGGSEALDEPYMVIGFGRMIRKRAGWLTALFLGEMLTATAMSAFEAEIARAVVLALFVPLIISSGGNSGSQASTLVIRALALGEVGLRDWWKVARREIGAGLALGGILGSIGFLRISIWSLFSTLYGEHWLLVALTVGIALVGVVLWGTLMGSLLPFVLRRLGFDPATSSAPFVATLVDVTGLVIYFTVALILLRGTLL